MKSSAIYRFACAALALVLPLLATAQPAPEQAGATGSAIFNNPVATAELAAYRGGTEVVHNEMTLAGSTTDNTAINVATGSNAISAGAFSSMSGLPVVIQNSGANVLIQNAVILNLQIN
jgi:hypothetical protein